jgi:Subtilisin-like serine proteases
MKHYIIFIFLLLTAASFAQTKNPTEPPHNWQLMDWEKDGYPGISLEKAYDELLANKKPHKKIVVAIIDTGLDDKQPDLEGMVWTNKKEIPGNNIDDDQNGFVDDVHGWNFIGSLKEETYEEIREYVRLKDKFENNPDSVVLKSDPQYAYWKQIVAQKDKKMEEFSGGKIDEIINAATILKGYWSKKLAKDSVQIMDIKDQQPDATADSSVINSQILFNQGFIELPQYMYSVKLTALIEYFKKAKPNLTEPYKNSLLIAKTIIEKNDAAYYRKKELGDDPYVITATKYGDSNIFSDQSHGTQCAGIIAALRNNSIGSNGITNSVEIMPIRIFTLISDEHDKDVANGIRYAVDNGAQIINMSFGKKFSPMKTWVDDAMKYAEQKGVLLIAAAMNDATNTDSIAGYPCTYYNDKTIIPNLIKVGASSYDSTLVGNFSNYGSNSVQVFAPGVSIYSTLINNTYGSGYGTSFASPIVAGLAAMLWSYYPEYTYKQIRYCIEKSATPINTLVIKPGTNKKVPFSSLSKSGGIVNAYKALIIAEQINKPSWKRKHKNEILN